MESAASRLYPALILFLLLLVSMILGMLLGSGLAVALGLAQGLNLQTIMAMEPESITAPLRTYLRQANLVSHFFTFSVSGLAVTYWAYRRKWLSVLTLDRAPRMPWWWAAPVLIFLTFPLAQATYWLNQQLPLSESLLQMEESASKLVQALLVMDTPGEFLLNLLVVAVLPAFGEELIFRGIVQRELERVSRRPILAIWVSAAFFSAIHFQFAGFLPRLMLGAVLGYSFYWSRNLWVPILAHFFFNGIQVAAQYFFADQAKQLDPERADQPQWLLTLGSLAILLALGHFLRQQQPAPEATPSDDPEVNISLP